MKHFFDTPSSLRIFVLLAASFGLWELFRSGYPNTVGFTQVEYFNTALSLIFTVGYLYCAVELPALIRTRARALMLFFVAEYGWSLIMIGMGFMRSLPGATDTAFQQLVLTTTFGAVVSTVFAYVLVLNVYRLSGKKKK